MVSERPGFTARTFGSPASNNGQGVSDGKGLPFLVNVIGAVDVAAGQILQQVVAVETPTALTDLHEPFPDVIDGRMDRDRASVLITGLRN